MNAPTSHSPNSYRPLIQLYSSPSTFYHRLPASPDLSTRESWGVGAAWGGLVYYVIEVNRWCIALHREAWMRLTYRRDYLPERQLWRDFLVSAEPLPAKSE